MTTWPATVANVRELSQGFATQRSERQRRTRLDPADFAALRAAGLHASGLPESLGGLWRDLPSAVRPLCDALRWLARGDPSVALVAAMHPTVLVPWLALEEAPPSDREAWRRQRAEVFAGVAAGAWWGTVKSEPGSGGDVTRTRSVARRGDGGGWRITGDKHFASGSGVTSFMITAALPEGEDEPDVFFLDVRDVPWDGSRGMKLVAEWEAFGMRATQSHAFRFDAFPAWRTAWPGAARRTAALATTLDHCVFSAVVVGVVEAALAEARQRLGARHDALRAYERVEGARAENEAWLVEQAFEGMLRAVEAEGAALATTLRGKTVIAELAERVLGRLCRALGGVTYAASSPFAAWAEDVRALGFLRPPWALAFDQLHELGAGGR